MTYHVTVTREDGLWVANIAELSPGATDVEHFADLETEVRDLISGLSDADPDELEVSWRYVVDETDVTDVVQSWARAERELAVASSAREEARANVMSALRHARMSQAAIGDLLGLSHQRVHQLVKAG